MSSSSRPLRREPDTRGGRPPLVARMGAPRSLLTDTTISTGTFVACYAHRIARPRLFVDKTKFVEKDMRGLRPLARRVAEE